MADKIRHFYEFEDFRLDAVNRSLWRGGELVSISPKALETLILMVTRKGEIVARDELLEKVWKNTFVEEGNINYTISLLRKTLGGKEFIQTIPKRGYRFSAEVKEITPENEPSALIEPAADTGRRPRWIFVSIIVFSVLILTSFAFYLRGDTPQTPRSKESAISEAMKAYTRGQMILDKRSTDNREEKAIDEFQKAVTLDPTFALAYAGLAEVYSTGAVRLTGENSLDYYAKAKSSADKALALDENLAEGYSVRGWIRRNADRDWPGAENDLRRAIAINPENALDHYRLAYILIPSGKLDEARAEIDRAFALDPTSEIISMSRFPILEARGEYDEGLRLAQDFYRENKQNPQAARALATFFLHKHLDIELIALGDEVLPQMRERRPFGWLSLLAAANNRAGSREKAAEYLKELETQAASDPKALYSLAMNYAEGFRTDEALAALEKCFERREERMIWLAVEPRFANLRGEPRFRELIAKMNLK